jgi:uncharacterized protein
MPDLHDLPIRLWLLLAAGPVLFLLAFVALSVALTTSGVPSSAVGLCVANLVPHTLLFVLVCLGLGLWAVPAEAHRAWQMPPGTVVLADLVIGILCGLALAAVYLVWLTPVLIWLQQTMGDFMPPGSTRQALTGSLGVFFVANVLLAPLAAHLALNLAEFIHANATRSRT